MTPTMRWHGTCWRAYRPAVVPPTVIAEVCYLLSERAGAAAEVGFLRSFEAGELELADLTLPDVGRMAELSEQYASLGLGGTDTSTWPSPNASRSRRLPPWTAGTSESYVQGTSMPSRFYRPDG